MTYRVPSTPKVVERRFVTPVVTEIVDPRSGLPATARRARPSSQRSLVVESLLRVPAR